MSNNQDSSAPRDSDHDSQPRLLFAKQEKGEREDSVTPESYQMAIEPLLTPQKDLMPAHIPAQTSDFESAPGPPNNNDPIKKYHNVTAKVHLTTAEVNTGDAREHNIQPPKFDVGNKDPSFMLPKALPQCDICFAAGGPKKLAKEATEEDVRSLSAVEVNFEGMKIRPFLLAKEIRTQEAVCHGGQECDANIHSCSDCLKDFKRMSSLNVFNDPGDGRTRERKLREVNKHLLRYCNRRKRNQPTSTKTTISSRQCFLKHKSKKLCAQGNAGMRVPSVLTERNDLIRKAWSEVYSLKAGVSLEVTAEIISRCKEVSLCSIHGSMFRNLLAKVENEQRACSLCGNKGQPRGSRRITRFDWAKLQQNSETQCVVEDPIAACFDNTVSPYDVKQVCDSCRRLILRDIDVRENVPRDHDERYAKTARLRRSKKGRCFTHSCSPTRTAICMLINWVREQLLEQDKDVVLMRDIRKKYDEFVIISGEQDYALNHDRSIKKYIQPSLSLTEIYADVGSKKMGTFFSCRSALRRLAAAAKAPPKEAEISADEESMLLNQFKEYILYHQGEICSSRWTLAEYVSAIPNKLWFRRLRALNPVHMLRGCKSRAKLQNKSYYRECPCNPQECPANMHSLPAYEFTFVTALYFRLNERYSSAHGGELGDLF